MRALGMLVLITGVALCLTVVAADLCPEGESIEPSEEIGLFDSLTETEIMNVMEYMMNQTDLDISPVEDAHPNMTYIFMIEAMPQRKVVVLDYLEGNRSKPDRNAKVVLYRGSTDPPTLQEYRVGPLPNPSFRTLIRYPKWNFPIPYHARSPAAMPETKNLLSFLHEELAQIDHILGEFTGYYYTNCTDDCLIALPGLPGDFVSGTRRIWMSFCRKVEGFYLHPVGFQLRVDIRYHEPRIDQVYFKGEIFNNLDEFLRAYNRNMFQPRFSNTQNYNDSRDLYSSLHVRGNLRPENPQRGPRSYYPDGRRYSVTGHDVTWMGWSFTFSMRSVLGMQIHNVKFLNERILYELSLQEISVRTGGRDPQGLYSAIHASLVFLGRESYELFPGVDCPRHADYFDFIHYLDGHPFMFKKSVCLFESDKGIPLRRHYDTNHRGGYNFYHGMPDNVLVLRSVVTAYMYDYIVDYVFHQNGAVEVVMSLSGYILSSYYMGDEDDKFGFKVFPDGLGLIHNHFAHFKADLDIQGRDNRFETLSIKMDEVPNPYKPLGRVNVLSFERNLHRTEKDAAQKYNFEAPKYYLQYNAEKVNAYNNPRAYRIVPQDIVKLLMPESFPIEKSFSWARYQVAVTKYKDSEYCSTTMYNSMDESTPVLDFQQYIDDNENIIDEDLVTWITLGTVHIPHSEDIPLSQTTGTQLRFFLLPFNYFDEDPSLASRDNIRVTPGEENDDGEVEHEYEHAGVDAEVSCFPRSGASNVIVDLASSLVLTFTLMIMLKFRLL